ncbi:MAG: hypothetical protein C0614_09270 [Desulfuromonas sp.]|nr:MAG: hypothetical protein C0614_09270 [Desulfuromonas sp.]
MNEGCQNAQRHTVHFCKLLQRGEMEEIDRLSVQPTVRCVKCGAEADLASSVCQPMPLTKR